MGYKASCTWGEGPDVLVSLNPDSEDRGSHLNNRFILHEHPITRAELDANGHANQGLYVHGSVESGSFDLTAAEATELAKSLLAAANACDRLDKSYEQYVILDAGKCEHRGEHKDKAICVKDSDAEVLTPCDPLRCTKGGNHEG